MPDPCYYHPDTTATGNCVQCGVPICDACTDRINQKPVCKNCVAAVRARLEREMAAPAGAYAAPSDAPGPQAQSWPPPATNPAYGAPSAALAPLDPTKLTMGIVVALVIGIVGCIALEKLLLYAHFGLSYLYILVGYGIGWGLHRMTGRGGTMLAAMAVGVFVVSLIVEHLVYAGDVLQMLHTGADADPSATFGEAFKLVLTQSGIMHWVVILIGLYACYRGVMRRQ